MRKEKLHIIFFKEKGDRHPKSKECKEKNLPSPTSIKILYNRGRGNFSMLGIFPMR